MAKRKIRLLSTVAFMRTYLGEKSNAAKSAQFFKFSARMYMRFRFVTKTDKRTPNWR